LNAIITTSANGELTERIREIFAQVTRYPLEILVPDASLEEDLGIDSVKLGEVFAVLRENYDLAENTGIPREQLRTIGSISEALQEYLKAEHREAVRPVAAPATAQPGDFRQEVQSIFASVTRYPLDVLELNASLEEDLGIDSVKLGEVFAVMRERYGLPEKMDLSREQTKTIAGISDALAAFLGATSAPAKPKHSSNGHHSPEEISQSVRQIFADVTRYPLDILELGANLEEDLGIDSVKLGEIFAVLRERYALPEDAQIPRESLKTIAGIAQALRTHLEGVAGVVAMTPEVDVMPAMNGNGAHPYSNGTAAGYSSAVLDSSFAALTPQRKPFEGKIALITGSGRALGKDIAIYLAELGASVVVNSFHSRAQGELTVEEIRAAGGQAVHAWGSVANPEHMKSIFEVVDKTYGGLDFLICNASNGMLAPLEAITVEHWEKAFRTNVWSWTPSLAEISRLITGNSTAARPVQASFRRRAITPAGDDGTATGRARRGSRYMNPNDVLNNSWLSLVRPRTPRRWKRGTAGHLVSGVTKFSSALLIKVGILQFLCLHAENLRKNPQTCQGDEQGRSQHPGHGNNHLHCIHEEVDHFPGHASILRRAPVKIPHAAAGSTRARERRLFELPEPLPARGHRVW